MDYIGDKKSWLAFLERNEGEFEPDLIKEPTMYPCYAYTTIDSLEFGWMSPVEENAVIKTERKTMSKSLSNPAAEFLHQESVDNAVKCR